MKKFIFVFREKKVRWINDFKLKKQNTEVDGKKVRK